MSFDTRKMDDKSLNPVKRLWYQLTVSVTPAGLDVGLYNSLAESIRFQTLARRIELVRFIVLVILPIVIALSLSVLTSHFTPFLRPINPQDTFPYLGLYAILAFLQNLFLLPRKNSLVKKSGQYMAHMTQLITSTKIPSTVEIEPRILAHLQALKIKPISEDAPEIALKMWYPPKINSCPAPFSYLLALDAVTMFDIALIDEYMRILQKIAIPTILASTTVLVLAIASQTFSAIALAWLLPLIPIASWFYLYYNDYQSVRDKLEDIQNEAQTLISQTDTTSDRFADSLKWADRSSRIFSLGARYEEALEKYLFVPNSAYKGKVDALNTEMTTHVDNSLAKISNYCQKVGKKSP